MQTTTNESDNESAVSNPQADDLSTTTASTPMTSGSSSAKEMEASAHDIEHYIAVGCLHFNQPIRLYQGPIIDTNWTELLHASLPSEIKLILGNHATSLLDARWIRLFLHRPEPNDPDLQSLVRLYLLPEDWGRRFIDRSRKSLRASVRHLLQQVDVSPDTWAGKYDAEIRYFDPWATAEPVSLYYLFNKLPSPSPSPDMIKNRYSRAAVQDLAGSSAPSEWEDHGEQPLPGLRTRLYPYQAQSASLMIQREAAPRLQLDPRLEVRKMPTGDEYFFGAREGSFLQEPRYYESSRGGILAETMGLGKTLICLAVILATKGHLPQIPPLYRPAPQVRGRVGTLMEMAASILGRNSIPANSFLEQSEANSGNDFAKMKEALHQNLPFYEIPAEVPRMNRNTKIPPPRQLVLCSSTIVVVPRNLLHQWQSEIRKHVLTGGMKILVVDSAPKRGNKAKSNSDDGTMVFVSELPAPTVLMTFDVILFTRNRFEREISDGADDQGRRATGGVSRACNCAYIGATRIPNCNCLDNDRVYESPLKKLHWLRIIIDEGHSFSSSNSNAVLVAKHIQAERRWVVSGTPAKDLVGIEVDISTTGNDEADIMSIRNSAIEQRKSFNMSDENSKAAKALGSLASNFLMVRPWCDSGTEGKLDWDEYIYRHEHQYRKTYSGFSSCFLRTLEGLVVKTRPEDVDRQTNLPPMTQRVVYLKPCWYDKMTANLFVQVLRANAITSERTDVDYLFHKNSAKARHSLIRNLRQSNFTWTGFSLEDVVATLETSDKYLTKDDIKCSLEDRELLLESSQIVSRLASSAEWLALSKAHEVGMAIEDWPTESEKSFALSYPARPTVVGITQLLDGQLHVDSNILSEDPAAGLEIIGNTAREKVLALARAEDESVKARDISQSDPQLTKIGVPSSCVGVGGQHSLPSRRATAISSKMSPQKTKTKTVNLDTLVDNQSPVRPKKRKLTPADEMAMLPLDSQLRKTRVIGTTSAKLTYLLEKVMQHQASEKIIIFYEGDNAAYYIAQCLEMLYVNHRIYARTLDNTRRSEYVALFNEDPDVRVLLIDVACGALGLNLNVASVVLIVNPINRPNIHAQAIKRAHRIGQTRKVLVETLVLEDTIEHAIYNRAQKMSLAQHLEAKELEDDEGIVQIIQHAQVLPIASEEDAGLASFALLKEPQQVFGRPERHKFHRFGFTDQKITDKRKPSQVKMKSSKRVKVAADSSHDIAVLPGPSGPSPYSDLSLPEGRLPHDSQMISNLSQVSSSSIFGNV